MFAVFYVAFFPVFFLFFFKEKRCGQKSIGKYKKHTLWVFFFKHTMCIFSPTCVNVCFIVFFSYEKKKKLNTYFVKHTTKKPM